jgi:hypothetical protein
MADQVYRYILAGLDAEQGPTVSQQCGRNGGRMDERLSTTEISEQGACGPAREALAR